MRKFLIPVLSVAALLAVPVLANAQAATTPNADHSATMAKKPMHKAMHKKAMHKKTTHKKAMHKSMAKKPMAPAH